ncbi:MAG: ATP-binding protein [Anaerolineales bacterium]
MTGHFLLDGSLLSVSLFNAILMLWLGLTVLLNAGHRSPGSSSGSWGFWIAAVGLMLGGGFFVFHSILLGYSLSAIIPALQNWWRAGWITVVLLPFSWYVVMLWYSGFWEEGADDLVRRHRPWFLFCAASALAWIILALTSNAFPTVAELSRYELEPPPAESGFPGVMLAYPPFIVLYIVLAFDALRRPGPTTRLMGAAARLRARPWFSAASLVFLAVCLLVGIAEWWVLLNVRTQQIDQFLTVLGILDLVIAALIGLATLLLGQAVVAYEVFTGRILPRRGLARYWRNAVLLAAGYSLVVGGSLAGQVMPITILLLATVMMTVFYALLGRRSYTERDSFLEVLRPFVTSQRLYEQVTAGGESPLDADAAGPFRALCSEILGCDRAALMATGPMAALWGPPLTYPESFSPSLPLPELSGGSSRPAVVNLEAGRADRLRWALTLSSRRGPIGLLLLGEKRGESLYAQEDFEIAQAACERFIDTQTSAELTRRLVAIQRERLVGSRILDRKTRRVLHDEILPALHISLLALSGKNAGDPESEKALADLAATHRRISQLLLETPSASPSEDLSGGIVEALRRLLEVEMTGAFDGVHWQIDPLSDQAARALPPMYLEVWFYAAREALRNAARYGRGADGSRPLHLAIALSGSESLELAIEDDGVGVHSVAPAKDATGQGLALHSTMMAVIGGELTVENRSGEGTVVRLSLPNADTHQSWALDHGR